jgi:hypothetical protein
MMWETKINCVRASKAICIGNLQFDQQFFFLFDLDNDVHWSHFAQAFHMFLLLEIHICIVISNEVRWTEMFCQIFSSSEVSELAYNHIQL